VDGVIEMFSKRGLASLALAVCALFSVYYWWKMAQPQIVVDTLSDRLSCVSYGPHRKLNQSPFDKTLRIDPAQIERDLALLSQRFNCVRTYSVSQGMDEVLRVADKLGMQVIFGIWISGIAPDNEIELSKGIGAAQKYPRAIRAIVVGNEVLLRREQPVSALRGYIERVKAGVPGVPVTYADIWAFWQRHKELADAVAFVTIHILPYWDDNPPSIETAVAYADDIYRRVKADFPDKEVMIGETGWPSYGRQRLGAEPSLVNQARFIREFAVRIELEKIPYNVIEAFDQPWKANEEGAVGSYWGILDNEGAAKFPFRGPVAEAPAWRLAAYGFMGLFCAGLLLLERKRLNGDSVLALVAIGIASGGAWTSVCRDMLLANRNLIEWVATGFFAAAMLAAAQAFGRALMAWCVYGAPLPGLASASHLLRWIRRNDQSHSPEARRLGALRFLFLFGAAYVGVLMVFDARMRDFPSALYAAPALGMALMAWISPQKNNADVEEIVLAGVIGFSGLWTAINENFSTPRLDPWGWPAAPNCHALGWAGVSLLLAGAVLLPAFLKLRPGQHQDAQ
jgi:glucan 1,3-beta-glucosidase